LNRPRTSDIGYEAANRGVITYCRRDNPVLEASRGYRNALSTDNDRGAGNKNKHNAIFPLTGARLHTRFSLLF
jgi:hypothetical protein